jgi:hypothetical protein
MVLALQQGPRTHRARTPEHTTHSDMSDTNASNPIRLPIPRLAASSVLACLLIAFAGALIASTQSLPMSSAFWTLAPALMSVFATLLVLNLLPPRPIEQWAIPVLGGTIFRAGFALAFALVIFFLFSPDRFAFFLTLVTALVAVLIIDVFTIVAMIQSAQANQSNSAADTHVQGATPEGA